MRHSWDFRDGAESHRLLLPRVGGMLLWTGLDALLMVRCSIVPVVRRYSRRVKRPVCVHADANVTANVCPADLRTPTYWTTTTNTAEKSEEKPIFTSLYEK